MNITVRNGTVKSGYNLCDSCEYHRIRRHENNHYQRMCSIGYENTRWAVDLGSPVIECSAYSESGNTSLGAMKSTAWYSRRDLNGNITFMDPNAMDDGGPTLWEWLDKKLFGKRHR